MWERAASRQVVGSEQKTLVPTPGRAPPGLRSEVQLPDENRSRDGGLQRVGPYSRTVRPYGATVGPGGPRARAHSVGTNSFADALSAADMSVGGIGRLPLGVAVLAVLIGIFGLFIFLLGLLVAIAGIGLGLAGGPRCSGLEAPSPASSS